MYTHTPDYNTPDFEKTRSNFLDTVYIMLNNTPS